LNKQLLVALWEGVVLHCGHWARGSKLCITKKSSMLQYV